MKKLIILFTCLSVCVLCFGAVASGRLHFKEAGFSIQPLDAAPANSPYQALMMYLPSADGFAPNVNVQIQPYAGTMDEYVAISKKQFAQMKLTCNKETRPNKNTVTFEYTGTVSGRSLRWYSKAVSTGTRVYLATATATEAQWKPHGAKLKACVDTLAANTK